MPAQWSSVGGQRRLTQINGKRGARAYNSISYTRATFMKFPDALFSRIAALFLFALLLWPSLASAQQGGGYYRGHMWDGGWHGWLFGPMMMLLFVGLVVVVVVIVVRWAGNGETAPGRSPDKSPIEILEERFARGEIDKEEFEERRRVLRN